MSTTSSFKTNTTRLRCSIRTQRNIYHALDHQRIENAGLDLAVPEPHSKIQLHMDPIDPLASLRFIALHHPFPNDTARRPSNTGCRTVIFSRPCVGDAELDVVRSEDDPEDVEGEEEGRKDGDGGEHDAMAAAATATSFRHVDEPIEKL
ncbi:hypothetical protein TIFTF001_008655 [Ficus carica]|uniref:Uncharacterized protein n=1 Tax=Ficus carica TaxID=3494 RepID=A0AA88D316_FICCA|nr:hypothetical protein TIFTF001_008655 [Ficus carica]